jgi:hypothetical protein
VQYSAWTEFRHMLHIGASQCIRWRHRHLPRGALRRSYCTSAPLMVSAGGGRTIYLLVAHWTGCTIERPPRRRPKGLLVALLGLGCSRGRLGDHRRCNLSGHELWWVSTSGYTCASR